MPRHWRCANGHAWQGELGPLTFCPECRSPDVFEVRTGQPDATPDPPPDTGISYSQSLRHRPRSPLVPPPLPTDSGALSTQEFTIKLPSDRSTVVVMPAAPDAAPPPAPPTELPPGDTLICDASCLVGATSAANDRPDSAPSGASDSTMDAPPDADSSSSTGEFVEPPTETDPSRLEAAHGRASLSGETMDESPPSEPPESPSEARVPDIAGYEVLGVLGRGGMGVVYKARQRGLNRLVALKMIIAGAHAGAHERERFRAEALAVAKLQHPNIVQVYEVGERDGLPFFSLEFVDGGSLQQRLNGQPLEPRQAAALVELLARAVQYAHANGIVHRDLKPANILLKVHDDADTQADSTTSYSAAERAAAVRLPYAPKITDFGLAKDLQSESGMTGTGAILGTPSYMSPEQAEGRTKEIGPATDIHALGAILYDALTGRPPFLGADPMATILQVRNMEPVPPRRWQPAIPRDLETICLKCLEKSPHRRYTTAGDLAEDLRRFVVGEPIRARPTSWLEKIWKWSLRRPTAAALIALSAVTLVGAAAAGVAVARLQHERAEIERHNAIHSKQLQDLAEKQRDRAQRESERAQANFDAARQAMDVFLTRVGDQKLRNEPRTERLQRDLLESAVAFYEQFLKGADGADPAVRREAGWALQRVGRVREMQGDRRSAIEAYQSAATLFADLAAREPDQPLNRKGEADSLRQLAAVLEAASRRPESDAAFRRASDLLGQLVQEQPDAPNYRIELASLLNSRAAALAARGEMAAALAAFHDALAMLRIANESPDAPPEVRLEAARTQLNLGGVLLAAQRIDEGRREVESGVAALESLAARSNDPVYAREFGRGIAILGYARSLVGQTEPAIAGYRRAAELFARLAAQFPRVPDFRFERAKALDNIAALIEPGSGLPAGAADRDAARAIYRQLSTDHPDVDEYRHRLARSLNRHAALLEQQGRPDAAAAALRESLPLLERLAAADPFDLTVQTDFGEVLLNLGILLARQEQYGDAEALYARSAAVLGAALARRPAADAARAVLILTHLNQAGLMKQLGRGKDEIAAWSHALELQKQRAADSPDKPDLIADVARSLFALAVLHRDNALQRQAGLLTAYDRQKAALKLAPGRADLIANLGVYGTAIVEFFAQRNDFAKAAAEARRVSADMPPAWPGLVTLAEHLAQCAAAARNDPRLKAADRDAAIRTCGDTALALLRRAAEGGFRDAARLQSADEFREIREAPEFRDEFAKLLATLPNR